MDRDKNTKISEIHQVGFVEKTKYVMPVEEFDVQFMQQNYNKFRVRNNDDVVPVWSVQRKTFDNSYCEFEIAAGSEENAESYGNKNSAGETTIKQSSTYSSNKNITVGKLEEEIDFATYMKIVNVFKESDTAIAGSAKDQLSLENNVVIDQKPSIKVVDLTKTAKSETPFVTLCVPSGEKLTVALSNFHGFWKSCDGVQCRVCLVMVEDVEAHKMEIRHMKRIASTINNVHCVRKIGPILNHCVLCNAIIENIEHHLKTNTAHTKHLEKALKSSIPEIANGIPENADAEKASKYQRSDNVCPVSVDNTETSDHVCPASVSNTETSDNVCPESVGNTENRVFIPEIQPLYNPSQTMAHVKGHKAQLFKMKNKVSISKSNFNGSNNLAYCKFCDIQMHINNLKSHKQGKYHKAVLDWKAKNKIGSTSKPESFGFRYDVNYRPDDTLRYNVGYTLDYSNGFRYNYGYGYQLVGLNYYYPYYFT